MGMFGLEGSYVRSLIVRGTCILGIVAAVTSAQGAQLILQPQGLTTISPGGGPNGEITIDVFVDNIVSPDALRSYQIILKITPLAGATGSFGLVDPDTLYPSSPGQPHNQSIFVKPVDPSGEQLPPPLDWVFFGQPGSFEGYDPTTLKIGAALTASDVEVTEPKYLGTYIFKASAGASGDFQIEFDVAAPNDPVQPTQLRPLDCVFCLIPFTVAPANGITVTVSDAVANDSCANASAIADGATGFSTANATTDGPSHPGSGCDQAGSSTVSNDIWYDYVSSCSGILTAGTCGDANFDTRVAVYDGCSCPVSDAELLTCNDDATGCGGATSEAVVNGVSEGNCYKIRVGATGDVRGSGSLTVTCMGNDLCASADPISAGSNVPGSTRNTALNDGIGPDCGLGFVDSPGVWYSVVGTGNLMTASLPSASYDTRLTVYQGGCAALTCLGDADNVGDTQESVSWCSTSGVPYLILVHGAGGASGTFTLDMADTSCDDANACTTNGCSAGACVNNPDYDTDYCCAPSTRDLILIDDGNPCTNDVCNANGTVSHNPVPDGPNAACDDLLRCTLDECRSGSCAHTDINTISCLGDLQCPGETTCGDEQPGFCYCISGPRLELIAEPGGLPVAGCYAVGEFILVRVELGTAEDPIIGAQFFLEYDASTLDFLSIQPGVAVDENSPFALEFNETVLPGLGTIDYVVGTNFGSSTLGPATVAVLTFQALAECDAYVRYRPSGPNGEPNRLTGIGGNEVVPNLIDLSPVSINGSPPILTSCPSDIITPTDPGQFSAVVSWTLPSATDSCDAGQITAVCSPPSGSTFQLGTTGVTCSAMNSCGISDSSCTFSVTVDSPSLTVDVELSATVDPGPFQRCITFEAWDCDATPGPQHVTVDQTLTFTNGLASGVAVSLPGGAWDCLTAQDKLHTLRSTAVDFSSPDGVTYTASCVGSRAQGGHWLVGGNLNGDEYIDILDFGVLFPQHLSLADPDTPCGTPGPDANINGDNLIDLLDLVIFVGNSLEMAEPGCCGVGFAAGVSGPVMSISVRELWEMGLEHLIVADVNQDGVLDMQDVTALVQGTDPPDDDGRVQREPPGKLRGRARSTRGR